jgi:hypothetical protein
VRRRRRRLAPFNLDPTQHDPIGMLTDGRGRAPWVSIGFGFGRRRLRGIVPITGGARGIGAASAQLPRSASTCHGVHLCPIATGAMSWPEHRAGRDRGVSGGRHSHRLFAERQSRCLRPGRMRVVCRRPAESGAVAIFAGPSSRPRLTPSHHRRRPAAARRRTAPGP